MITESVGKTAPLLSLYTFKPYSTAQELFSMFGTRVHPKVMFSGEAPKSCCQVFRFAARLRVSEARRRRGFEIQDGGI